MLKLGKYKAQTTVVSGGAAVLSIKVPGDFATIDKSLSTYSGRDLKEAAMFFGSPASGDEIISISLQDIDGVIPAGLRAAFPSYPIISDSSSDFQAENQGMYIPTTQPVNFTPFGGGSLIPSGVYIVISVKKASAVVDNFYVNLLWDDRQG